MSDQPEALRVATKLDEDFSLDHVTTTVPYAARLLREQHAEIERLREEVRKWQKSFGGHLYVKTEDYAELVGKLREQHAEIENLICRKHGLAMQNSPLRATVEAMKRTEAAMQERGMVQPVERTDGQQIARSKT